MLRAQAADHASAARAAYEACRYAEARREFRVAIATQPNDVELNFYLGRLALWFDDQTEALGRLEAVAAKAPEDARLQNALGDAYGLAAQNAAWLRKLGWAQKCRRAYERAVELAPEDVSYRWSLLGYHLVAPRIAGGDSREARAQAAEIARRDPMAGRVARATLALAEGRAAAAFAEFDEILRDQPDDFLALYHLGRCAALSGEQLERGRAALQQCLQLPVPRGDVQLNRASIHYRLGNILEKLGHPQAVAEYAAAKDAQPDFNPAKIALKY